MQPLATREAVFVPADPPRSGAFAFWGEGVEPNGEVELVLPAGSTVRRRLVPARLVPVREAVAELLDMDIRVSNGSMAAWATAVTAAVGLVGRGRLLPAASAGGYDAWRIGPLDKADVTFLQQLAAAFPPAAHALPVEGSRPLAMRSPESLIHDAWDGVADALVRTAAAPIWSGGTLFAAEEPEPVAELAPWLAEVGRGTNDGAQLGLRIELRDDADLLGRDEVADLAIDPSTGSDPSTGVDGESDHVPARAVLQLRSLSDPSLVVDAAELWRAPTVVLARLGGQVETDLLLGLRRAARAWSPVSTLLREAAPSALVIDDDQLADLLGEGATALASAGVELLWPAELFTDGLSLQATTTAAPGAITAAGFTMNALLDFQWQLTVAGEPLTQAEVDAIAEAKRPLVRVRGRWVAADPSLLTRLRDRKKRQISAVQALAATLTGTLTVSGEQVVFSPPAALADAAAALVSGSNEADVPADLLATLRPYQERGFSWLVQMCDSGLGGCLADDMGLGKTVQVIALHLHRRKQAAGPTLVVCPTSLLGNWQHELARFAPDVPVRRYHGGDRHLDAVAPDEVVLVTYGLLRRDRAQLAEVEWGLAVADEAQHVKNPLSITARELRRVPAMARVALTGTPVENRLTDLWAILDWTTPGLLGTLDGFTREVAVPVERYRDEDAAVRLQRLTRPFLLRRRKTDPGIAPELPAKTETDRFVGLTTEQATLYEAVVRETIAQIEAADGIERRGLVLKLLTGLKQICNHPAQYLKQAGPLAGRSGKLAALDELLDIITAEGDSVLVFSQYVGMARLLESHLIGRGISPLFLHGGVSATRREEMVTAFQQGDVPVFLLSIKAGGVGLNLTRATHVIHYDRWWNPAVEDQATDRAYRIGQDRPVQVHRLVAEGTLEDRIAALLHEKRSLADAVVGSGEAWLSEMSDAELADLVRLGGPG